MPNLLSLVQIGITTKNRWDDLKVTLEKIQEFGLGNLRVLIFDDCSDVPCPYDVSAFCPGAQLRRLGISRGLIVRRNEIAAALDAKYYLSLDDDSFPFAGSLEAAVSYAESLEDNFCLGFPIDTPLLNPHFEEPLDAPPHQVRSYIGCAHLLHRERFLALGGYRGELVHQGEENEVAVRAFQSGLHCYRFPGFQVRHMAANAGRSFYRMDYYGGRNMLLWNDWYLPPGRKTARQARTLAARLRDFAATRRPGYLRGAAAGLWDIRRYKAHRRPLSRDQYHEWLRLPPS